jgi:RNase P subunit RPR2
MVKYYKTIAQMFVRERSFFTTLNSSKGFCMHHYAELLKYAKSASFVSKEYVSLLSKIQMRNVSRLENELKVFCDKHDYRNALEPLGSAETALPRTRTKLYGKKYD